MADSPRDLFSVEGKTALVTGGTSGIGLMIARDFAASGARVYITSRKAGACEAVAAGLSGDGRCVGLPADLSRPEECVRLAADLGERESTLDIVVNNAGANWGAPLDEYPASGWDRVLDLNVKGLFHLTQALLPLLRSAASALEPARVINIGSVDGLRTPGGREFETETYAYSASKAAVHHLTRVLAKRLGPEHITVNAIAPGPFHSRMMAPVAGFADQIANALPLGRLGRDSDMAGAARFLASPAGSFVTGAVLCVDGGMALI